MEILPESNGRTSEIEKVGLDYQFNTAEVQQAAKEDMDFFGGLILPEVVTMAFPDFYCWLWRTLIEVLHKTRDFSKFAIGLPRGHGKTMVVKLLIVYAILFTKKRYILVIGANIGKAKAIIADVCDMLDSYNVNQVFGNWRYNLETDTQELKKFTFAGRSVILEAAGQGTAIRGSNHKNSRPDLMVFDDSQTKECAESITEAKSYQQWFIGTALKAKSPLSCTFIYIGNMYKDIEIIPKSGIYCCMLRQLQLSQGWTSFIVGGLLADGTALWEELQPKEQLIAEFMDDAALGQPEIFFAEVLNDPTTSTSFYLDTNKIICRRNDLGELHQGGFIVIDPATSKATPDQVIIHYFEIYDNIVTSVEMIRDKLTGPEIVYKAYEMAIRRGVGLIAVESNAYQYSLCEWFTFVAAQLGILGIHIQPLYSSKGKVAKILQCFQSAMKGEIHTTPATHSHIISEGQAFDPTKKNNVDDIWDTLHMGHEAAGQFRHLMLIPGNLSFSEQLTMEGVLDQSQAPPPCNF